MSNAYPDCGSFTFVHFILLYRKFIVFELACRRLFNTLSRSMIIMTLYAACFFCVDCEKTYLNFIRRVYVYKAMIDVED